MNWHCPDDYVEKSAQESISATADLIRYIQAFPLSPAQEPLVHPVITPRFAISCTPELLAELGELAETMPGVAIQTHISENQREVEDALKYFKADSYAGIYDKFKLLRHNTILAHGVWLTEKEMDLIADRGAGLSHCPTSNFYLSSGMARVGMLLDHGVKVRRVWAIYLRSLISLDTRSALALMSAVATAHRFCMPSRWPALLQRCSPSKLSRKSAVTKMEMNTTSLFPSIPIILLQTRWRRHGSTLSITIIAIVHTRSRSSPTKNLVLRPSSISRPKEGRRSAVYKIVLGHSSQGRRLTPCL